MLAGRDQRALLGGEPGDGGAVSQHLLDVLALNTRARTEHSAATYRDAPPTRSAGSAVDWLMDRRAPRDADTDVLSAAEAACLAHDSAALRACLSTHDRVAIIFASLA